MNRKQMTARFQRNSVRNTMALFYINAIAQTLFMCSCSFENLFHMVHILYHSKHPLSFIQRNIRGVVTCQSEGWNDLSNFSFCQLGLQCLLSFLFLIYQLYSHVSVTYGSFWELPTSEQHLPATNWNML